MANRQELILDAIAEAHEVHELLRSEELLRSQGGGGIEVFRAIQHFSVPFVFRPLEKLLGLYIPLPEKGIMLTSKRNRAIQRYTAAHELGHFILGHTSPSFDDKSILARYPFGQTSYEPNEMAADAFAAALLIPEWALEVNAERHGWSRGSLLHSTTVYQISLRIGASFLATCHQLYRFGLIDHKTWRKHVNTEVKKIKQALIPGIKLPDWHANVWMLQPSDSGLLLHGGPGDVFVFKLQEHSGGGFLWDVENLKKAGFNILFDECEFDESLDEVGSPALRKLIAKSDEAGSEGRVDLDESQPWDKETIIQRFALNFELMKEAGMPQVVRRAQAG